MSEVDDKLKALENPQPEIPRKILGVVVPEGALRIRVIDSKGATRWRKLDEVQEEDAPDLLEDGSPLFQNKPVGRPQKTELHDVMPPATKTVGDLIKVKAAQIRTDPIVQISEENPESSDVLHHAIKGLAEEAASLRFERMEAERQGTDSSQISVRRINALKTITDAWLKRKEQLNSKAIDLESPAFKKIIQYIGETIALSLQDAEVQDELADSVMNSFYKRLDDESWVSEAKARMKE